MNSSSQVTSKASHGANNYKHGNSTAAAGIDQMYYILLELTRRKGGENRSQDVELVDEEQEFQVWCLSTMSQEATFHINHTFAHGAGQT